MITFVILAAALTFAVAIAIAIPLLKRDKEATAQAPWTAMAVIAVLVVGAAASYVALSNFRWGSAQQTAAASATGPDSPAAMVERLKARLEQSPQDLEGWLMLGHSYMVLDQAPLAVRAYEHADRIAGGKSAEALVGLAEAIAVQDESALDREAGQMLEKALTIEPNNGKALFYGGAAAMRKGDLPVARQRFAALLQLNPPDNVKQILEQQIAAIDAQMGGGAPGVASAGTPSTAGNASTAGAQPNASNSAPSAASGGGPGKAGGAAGPAAVHVNVTLSPKLSANLPAGAPLFVFVRDPKQPGPPLAVKRLSNRFPQTVELTSADAMVPGRELTDGQQVQVVARIARSGTPTAQSGDPFGEVGYQVGRDKVVDIVIDRLTP
jgi:cytochrome c-type biogenesis protein CcmH